MIYNYVYIIHTNHLYIYIIHLHNDHWREEEGSRRAVCGRNNSCHGLSTFLPAWHCNHEHSCMRMNVKPVAVYHSIETDTRRYSHHADGVSTGQSTVRLEAQSLHFITQTRSNYKLHNIFAYSPRFVYAHAIFSTLPVQSVWHQTPNWNANAVSICIWNEPRKSEHHVCLKRFNDFKLLSIVSGQSEVAFRPTVASYGTAIPTRRPVRSLYARRSRVFKSAVGWRDWQNFTTVPVLW